MAGTAGLVLAERWSAWDGTPFTTSGARTTCRATAGSARAPPRMGQQ